MNVSAKIDYACLAMLELAMRHSDEGPVRIRDIADQHGIPSRFLVQILLQLKTAGLVQSIRGAAGGYQLAQPPDRITLAQVVSAADGLAPPDPPNGLESPAVTVLKQVWRELHRAEQQRLSELTLADLVARIQGPGANMYYI